MGDCPKCRGRMSPGYGYLPDTGTRVRWMEGKPGFWKSMTGSFRAADLRGSRCEECGFVELYVDIQSKPQRTLESLDGENERLRSLVAKLQDRVSTLEVIATDPGERTARQIEQLRHLPADDGRSK